MRSVKLLTKKYKNDPAFTFKGQEYFVHSVVRLTEEGRLYLGSRNREVVLIEQFTYHDGRLCWKYEFKSINPTTSGLINISTDRTPDELIEEVIQPASFDYHVHEELSKYGIQNVDTSGEKHVTPAWKIPEVRNATIYYIVVVFAVAIFKGWYVKLIIRIVASWFYLMYSCAYTKAYMYHTHKEDNEILKEKYKAYGYIKSNENDNCK